MKTIAQPEPAPDTAEARRRHNWQARSRRRRNVIRLSVLVLACATVFVGVHLRRVHDLGWEYRWSPSAAPPKVHFQDRDYLRGDVESALPPGEVPLGRTPGGGVIYGPAGPHVNDFTGIDVVASGRVTGYDLSGGP